MGSKITRYGDNILIGWNTFKNEEPSGSSFILLNKHGKVISPASYLDENVLYPSQSLQVTKDGENIIFVSSDGKSLTIHMIKIE